ncbi:MAG TPA: nuclear transport factor 2 family protein [Bacillota bacterium]|nr:nuclear transport factor 2 family protein [Bacillota bacterium]
MDVNTYADAEVRKALDFWFDAYTNRDAAGLLSMVAPDDNVVFIGMDADEKKLGREGLLEGIQRDFAQADSITVELPWVSIAGSGTVAWVAADYIYNVTSKNLNVQVRGRLTLIMEKRDEKWLIVHAHFSTPVDAEGKASPNIQ